MKILIIIVTLLLVPIVMKLQQKTFENRVLPVLTAQVAAVLSEEEVSAPEVEVAYLDATIGGGVDDWATAERVEERVLALAGIRKVTNRLLVRGNLKAAREKKSIIVVGLVPEGWPDDLKSGSDEIDLSKLQERATTTFALGDSLEWGRFIAQYFERPGSRAFHFNGETLFLTGEATPSLAKDLVQAAISQVGAEKVSAQFQLYPSQSHFTLREVESPLDGEALRSLQRSLLEGRISFLSGESELSETGEGVLAELANQILTSNSGLQFIIGAYPDSLGQDLALKRAQEVKNRLVAAGLPETSLAVTVYEMTEESREFAGQVEILLR